MALMRAQGRMSAPRRPQVQADTVTPEGISNALGVVGGAARQVQENIEIRRSEEERKAEEAFRKKQAADDNAAFIDAEIQYIERLTEAEAELQKTVPDNGDGYAKQLAEQRQTIQSQIEQGLPSYMTQEGRERVALRFKQLDASSRMSAAQWQDQKVTQYAATSYQKSVNVAVAQVLANPAQAQTLLAQSQVRLDAIQDRLTPDQKMQMESGTQQQLVEAAVTGFAEQGSYAAARDVIGDYADVLDTGQQKALGAIVERAEIEAENQVHQARSLAIQEGALDEAGLLELRAAGEIKDDGAYSALLGQAQQAERARQAQIDAANSEQQSRNFAGLQVGIAEGRLSKADADFLYSKGAISPAQWSQASRQAISARETQNAGMDFANALASGFPVDPMNPDAKKGADSLFVQNGGVDAWKKSIGDGMAATEQFAQVGIIPESARTILRGMKASGTEDQQMIAIQGIGELYTDYPNATDAAFTAGEVAEAISFRDKLDAGIDPKQAYQAILMEREVDRSPDFSSLKIRQSEGRKLAAELDFKDALKRRNLEGETVGAQTGALSFNRYSGGVLAEEQILRDYRQAFQTYFVQHGDEELAKKQAAAVMGRTVGVSKSNGNRIMMHPPERFYPGVEPEFLQNSLTSAVSDVYADEVKPKNIELISDIVTARDVREGRAPSYAVQVERDGVTDILPARWTFDEEMIERRAQERAELEADQKRERARRKALRKREAQTYQPSPVGTLSAIQQRPATSRQLEFEAKQEADVFTLRQRLEDDE